MLDFEKIGVGIVTCNRRESYCKLLYKVKSAIDVDFVITVKNLTNDYGEDDPKLICTGLNGTQKLHSIQVDEKLGIAHNKNLAAKWLLQNGAQHIFIIEDDILLKDVEVFKKYIQTAKEFHLEHLNFGRSFDTMILHTWLTPIMTISGKTTKLDIFSRLSGDFSYFTRNALEKAGLYDEAYINALDHCEHTYRMSLLGFYTPFYAFADIENSTQYIEDTGTTTTIEQNDQHKQDVSDAFKHFVKTYGYSLNEIQPPTKEKLLKFLQAKTL